MFSLFYLLIPIISLTLSINAFAKNNFTESFSTAKKTLLTHVYFDHHETLYCGASFSDDKRVLPLTGFRSEKYKKRAKRIEWEHVVPAENFGRTFVEWRKGDKACVNSKGKAFKGRKCADKTNNEYRLMQADMFNLYPAIGSVNALRSNYSFTLLPQASSDFGRCKMKIDNKKAEPPIIARGRIARSYLYMEETYSHYKMSKKQRALMTAWSTQFPVNQWECVRAKRITQLGGGENYQVQNECVKKKMW